MKKIMIIVSLLLIQGCTHTLYQSDIVSLNNLNEEQAYRLWWVKTSIFSKEKGSGSMTLDMGCSKQNLTDSSDGIVMILPADQYTSVNSQQGTDLSCAKVADLESIKAYKNGEVVIESYCTPVADTGAWGVVKKTFLKTGLPHHFGITKSEIKKLADSPQPLPCN